MTSTGHRYNTVISDINKLGPH